MSSIAPQGLKLKSSISLNPCCRIHPDHPSFTDQRHKRASPLEFVIPRHARQAQPLASRILVQDHVSLEIYIGPFYPLSYVPFSSSLRPPSLYTSSPYCILKRNGRFRVEEVQHRSMAESQGTIHSTVFDSNTHFYYRRRRAGLSPARPLTHSVPFLCLSPSTCLACSVLVYNPPCLAPAKQEITNYPFPFPCVYVLSPQDPCARYDLLSRVRERNFSSPFSLSLLWNSQHELTTTLATAYLPRIYYSKWRITYSHRQP